MKTKFKSKALALDSFSKAMKTLRTKGILINRKELEKNIEQNKKYAEQLQQAVLQEAFKG